MNQSLQIKVHDSAGKPVSGAVITVNLNGVQVQTAKTNDEGKASFSNLPLGELKYTVSMAGFQPLEEQPLSLTADSPASLDITLIPKIEVHQSVDVKADDTAVNKGSSPPQTMDSQQAKSLPQRPSTIIDALPTLPGVVRAPNGELTIAGGSEQHSALLVNFVDTTDPATGQFGLTIPVDSVESVNVMSSPFLSQYGNFSAGVVSALTRPGGDKWNYELNDPMPEFRIRSLHLQGLRSLTPHLTVSGPILHQRLYFAEAMQYQLDKTPVRTLPFPFNETTSTSINSFTQFDYIFNPTHTLTGTVHVAPQSTEFANLDFFNPQPVTPNFDLQAGGAALIDRLTLGRGVLQSTLAWQDFHAMVSPQSKGRMIITPVGNRGNYFSRQSRHSFRAEWLENYAFDPIEAKGLHNLQIGTTVARSEDRGIFRYSTIDLRDMRGSLLRRLEFTNGTRFRLQDLELATYIQDHWVLSQRLALDGGVRLERQTITGAARFAPRAGFVWSPLGEKRRTVFRGGVGVFYDHVPLNVFAFEHYPQEVVTDFFGPEIVLQNLQPFAAPINAVTQAKVRLSGVNRRFRPYSLTSSLELEQGIGRLVTLRAKFTNRDSDGLVAINPNPLANGQTSFVASAAGFSHYREMSLTAGVGATTKRKLFLAYTHSLDRGDLNASSGYTGNFPFPILNRDQVTNLYTDVPHRMLVWGETPLPWRMRITPLVEYRTGFPFTVTNALQQYVGVPNQSRFPNFFSLDTRLSKDFPVNSKYTLRLAVKGLNLSNHFNPLAVRANTGDPEFGAFFGTYKRRFKLDFDVLF
ncbi:MAG TPA: carboxypeptidase regulatory-like domain-containing protein [Candidatus Angelobacter sp.]|nr:carboxypeptidase regulatory-like domain-containing protein [Candidatus Angelobacter sp.]